MLRALLTGWRSLLHATAADVLIADHAPTALLAAQELGLPRAVIGSPFNVPPAVTPTPNMRDWEVVPTHRLSDSDARVLAVINSVRPKDQPLDALHLIADDAARFFSGIPELDHYGARARDDYLGLQVATTSSVDPEWPAGEGARVFAYLNVNYQHIERALQALAASGARVLVHVVGGMAALAHKFANERLAFAPELLDIRKVVASCDLCVCHGNFGTSLGMLQGGRPLLLLPMHLEHFLLGKSIERIGAGRVMNPDVEPDFAGMLAVMLGDPGYARGAQALAAREAATTVGTITDRVVARIEALAAQTRKNK